MNLDELKIKIDLVYLENLDTESHFSIFSAEKDYQILIIRGFSVNGDDLIFNSQGFFINNDKEVFEYIDKNFVKNELGFSKIDEILEPLYIKNEKIIEDILKMDN